MRDLKNMKKELFFEAKRDSRESLLGVKISLICEKKGLFGFYQRAFKGHFSNATKHVLQKACLGGVFLEEGKSQLGYVLKASGHVCVQQ